MSAAGEAAPAVALAPRGAAEHAAEQKVARQTAAVKASRLREATSELFAKTGDPTADAEAAVAAFLRAAEAGEAEVVERWLESRDRRRLMGAGD
eukprot:CAMPEP_0203886096 /NCGR_PEP_ID=MMETSP0359-20131031/29948_1 /ASSEMBLY_ACC=CAM_ASM_000338 /TAXON_ID=268821 /ORGANISM="Scrippsiella Hangoei, Strain SHTV-5" /LENGTH=93 /DNA_ID=CAMNT_0050806847 /DNA_START=21 /DNA_END=299 /DNA_ORIENTATION=+